MKKTSISLALLMTPLTLLIAQGVWVLSDTNQLSLARSMGIQLTYRTNLYEGETISYTTTNWVPVRPLIDMVTPDGKPVKRQYEALQIYTNVSHRIMHEGVDRLFIVSTTLGPVLDTRQIDIPQPMPMSSLTLGVPPRLATEIPQR